MASNSSDFPFGIMDVVELLSMHRRRPGANSFYVDCPFCGEGRGRMNVNYVKNIWRCNYCGESGGMLALYGRVHGISNSDAYREICDALSLGETGWGEKRSEKKGGSSGRETGFPDGLNGVSQSERASPREIHQTYSLLLGMLSLTPGHREHLLSEKRGFTEAQILERSYKSTPPFFLCRSLTERLLKQGCRVQGIPGFYLDEKGHWTVNFHSVTAGILIPCVGMDGLIRGLQILLDVPLKEKEAPAHKKGAKYIWLSSAGKHMGVTSGSPVHFAGDPFARTIYVTEGLLKADIAHYRMNRSFAAAAGVNNLGEMEEALALLSGNGTEQIVECYDMDKFSNEAVYNGKLKLYRMVQKQGMKCLSLTWNPNYNGVDDWQLALERKEKKEGILRKLDFKKQYLLGLCGIHHIDNQTEEWHRRQGEKPELPQYLGLTEEEYCLYLWGGKEILGEVLEEQRQCRQFRFYQLDFGPEQKPVSFAFKGIDEMHQAGYKQGSFSNRNKTIRNKALEAAKDAMDFAEEIGCELFAIWPGQDGYDYMFQADYIVERKLFADAIKELAEYKPHMQIALEYKPKEPRNKCYINSMAGTLLMIQNLGVDNVGIAMDYGHSFFCGENPAEAVALCNMYGGKIMAVHMNDNYGSWDDDMIAGSVNTIPYLEFIYWLRKTGYAGYITFDQFPYRENSQDAVKESAEWFDYLEEMIDQADFNEIEAVLAKKDGVAASRLIRKLMSHR